MREIFLHNGTFQLIMAQLIKVEYEYDVAGIPVLVEIERDGPNALVVFSITGRQGPGGLTSRLYCWDWDREALKRWTSFNQMILTQDQDQMSNCPEPEQKLVPEVELLYEDGVCYVTTAFDSRSSTMRIPITDQVYDFITQEVTKILY